MAVVAPSAEARTARFAFVDGLRACAALYVVAYHALLQVNWGASKPGSLGALTYGLFGNGWLAVDIFIVLSGFCLMLPVLRSGNDGVPGGIWRFYRQRAWRILPPYYCAIGLSCLLIALVIGHKTGTHWDASLPVTRAGLVSHLLLFQDLSPATYDQIDHPLWSIAVEWRIYLIFPLLLLLRRRFGIGRTVLFVFAAAIVQFLVNTTNALPLPHIAPQYYLLFVMGMLSAEWSLTQDVLRRRWREAPRIFALFIFALIAGGAALAAARTGHGIRLLLDVATGAATIPLLILLTTRSPAAPLCRVASWPPLAAIGIFSYSVYLIHAPLLQVLYQTLFARMHVHPLHLFAAYCLIGIPLILAAGYLFFRAFEQPFLRKPRRTLASLATDTVAAPAP